jgi:hypothetical protein
MYGLAKSMQFFSFINRLDPVSDRRFWMRIRSGKMIRIHNTDSESDLDVFCCSYGSEEEAERQVEGEGEGGSTTVAELQLTDWESLACLLCKRQFPVGAATVSVGRVPRCSSC